jgi:aminoglycoside 6'-N-acetyltransferase I
MDEWLGLSDSVVIVADFGDGKLGGFAEVGTRSAAGGCLTTPVAYLEGWWVDPQFRRRGVGAALIAAAETWAKAQGHSELASDALLDNVVSQAAHVRLGFIEVERVVLFRKALRAGAV